MQDTPRDGARSGSAALRLRPAEPWSAWNYLPRTVGLTDEFSQLVKRTGVRKRAVISAKMGLTGAFFYSRTKRRCGGSASPRGWPPHRSGALAAALALRLGETNKKAFVARARWRASVGRVRPPLSRAVTRCRSLHLKNGKRSVSHFCSRGGKTNPMFVFSAWQPSAAPLRPARVDARQRVPMDTNEPWKPAGPADATRTCRVLLKTP